MGVADRAEPHHRRSGCVLFVQADFVPVPDHSADDAKRIDLGLKCGVCEVVFLDGELMAGAVREIGHAGLIRQLAGMVRPRRQDLIRQDVLLVDGGWYRGAGINQREEEQHP